MIATESRAKASAERSSPERTFRRNGPLTQDPKGRLQVKEHERKAQDPVVDAEVLLLPRQPQPHEDGRQGRQEGEDDDRFLGFKRQHGGGRGRRARLIRMISQQSLVQKRID